MKGKAKTMTAAIAMTAVGRNRKGRASRLASAMWCRMPKKMKTSGSANQVAEVTRIAAQATKARRRR
jgi:hypothetical protein